MTNQRPLDNVPEFIDPDCREVTITITKFQARVVLSAINRRYCELENSGDDELRDATKAVYQLIDGQVYGVRLGREGIQEAGR
jgi:hypothetical protein